MYLSVIFKKYSNLKNDDFGIKIFLFFDAVVLSIALYIKTHIREGYNKNQLFYYCSQAYGMNLSL